MDKNGSPGIDGVVFVEDSAGIEIELTDAEKLELLQSGEIRKRYTVDVAQFSMVYGSGN